MAKIKDTGANTLKDGLFKMYPSGDIVEFDERNRLLPTKASIEQPLIFGRTHKEIANMQGIKNLKK